MAKNLVIVESPAKAKTIEKFLGKDFKVASSFGHVSDLPSKELGVDVEKDFKPKYIVSSDKKEVIANLKNLVKKAEIVWLASDEDREGEAIAWHLAQTLKLNDNNTKRIVFHEITKSAILKAIEQPRKLDYNLINAQQARRVLDRLVGYELSPVLWKKIKPGLSAGRVQSVSVRIVVDREREIKAFNSKSAYKTQAEFLSAQDKVIKAVLNTSFNETSEVENFLLKNAEANFSVIAKETKPAKKSPASPFTTSLLQQEASRKLYFSVSKTMTVAQRLYEAGLITYMRTDSVNLSKEAQTSALSAIQSIYGKEYCQTRNFTTKSKGAQEAHEAIRPTDLTKSKITGDYDQMRLYELIWKRTIASQMSDAKLERTHLKIGAPKHQKIFVAHGEVIKFEGFLKVYLEGVDDDDDDDDDVKGMLPSINQGDTLKLKSLTSTERFSKPPYRYSEAALVKKLEELGIGRPSTYAPTISTVQNRGYIVKGTSEGMKRSYKQYRLNNNNVENDVLIETIGSNKGKLIPTDIGMIVNDFLIDHFKNILDYNFTAQVEKDFDTIAEGNTDWVEMIKHFYKDFHKTIVYAQEKAERASGERVLGVDPKTGREVKVRFGKFGPIAQIGNPDDNEKPIYASLTPQQQLDTITFEETLNLFNLPKKIGVYEGEEVTTNNGRFGPYIKFGDTYISLPKETDPLNVDKELAISLIEEKRIADAPIYTYDELPVTKGTGRFGPFIKWKGMFINVNKKYDFDALSNSDIETLIKDKIQKEIDKIIHDWKEEGIRVEKARWGRSNIIKGKIKIELPKNIDASKITLEEAKKRIEAKTPKKKKPKAATKKKK